MTNTHQYQESHDENNLTTNLKTKEEYTLKTIVHIYISRITLMVGFKAAIKRYFDSDNSNRKFHYVLIPALDIPIYD